MSNNFIYYLCLLSTCAGLLTLFTSACYLWSSRRRTTLHLSDRQQFFTQVALIHIMLWVCLCHCIFKKINYYVSICTTQMLLVAVCAYVPSLTHSSLQQKQGLPLFNQIISWTTLGRLVWVSRHTIECHGEIKLLFGLYLFYILKVWFDPNQTVLVQTRSRFNLNAPPNVVSRPLSPLINQ